jgi:uncharacterized protein YdhG (YjbR/CyaY superfamily)
MKMLKPKNMDDYIAGFPAEIRKMLEQLRKTIKQAAPDAQETISYGMPAFRLNGNIVYFAAFKNHIGFYPIPAGVEKFKKELSVYKTGKGSIQFPLDQQLPLKLITKIVQFRFQRTPLSVTNNN